MSTMSYHLRGSEEWSVDCPTSTSNFLLHLQLLSTSRTIRSHSPSQVRILKDYNLHHINGSGR